jgi:hypothetical protein
VGRGGQVIVVGSVVVAVIWRARRAVGGHAANSCIEEGGIGTIYSN